MATKHLDLNKVSAAGLLITLGIIFGDIGTSPLYVLKAVVGADNKITSDVVLGGLSCIFWTLTLQTTVKYVLLTLKADNNGEGGIFALYALLKRMNKKWLIIPAVIGGSTLIADGFITPPISVASAIEGLRGLNPEIKTVPIILGIITVLFLIQQFGTHFIGKFFGPVMLTWFLMLGVLGSVSLVGNPGVIKALNPYWAYNLLVKHPGGFWILGAVFLCTTGAEALYSDLGHCGRKNIRVSWMFVKVTLLLNYFGQGAMLLQPGVPPLGEKNPFYMLMPDWFLLPGIIISTAATIVASQALISGSFTLINEAMRLNFWPKVSVKYPTELKGQLYIPSVNWILCAGCLGVVLFFKESSHMEAAYGLSIIITMIMTTILLVNFLVMKRYPIVLIYFLLCVFLFVECSFLIANLDKFKHGGYVTLFIATALISVMAIWYKARKIMNRYVEFTNLKENIPMILELSKDETIKKYATHLVFMTSADNPKEIEEKIIYSLLRKRPKRADIYWFVHIDVVDEPYCLEYKVEQIAPGKIIRVNFKLGFREVPRINLWFRKVVKELSVNREVNTLSRYESLSKENITGDFRFVVMRKFLSADNELPLFEEFILEKYFFIKRFSLSEEKAFGLDANNVTVETVPVIIKQATDVIIERTE